MGTQPLQCGSFQIIQKQEQEALKAGYRLYDLLTEVTALEKDIIEIRRHIHAHPELSYQELETSSFIAEKLQTWGYPSEERCGRAL